MPKEGDATTWLDVLMLFKRSVTGKTGGKYGFAHSESDKSVITSKTTPLLVFVSVQWRKEQCGAFV